MRQLYNPETLSKVRITFENSLNPRVSQLFYNTLYKQLGVRRYLCVKQMKKIISTYIESTFRDF